MGSISSFETKLPTDDIINEDDRESMVRTVLKPEKRKWLGSVLHVGNDSIQFLIQVLHNKSRYNRIEPRQHLGHDLQYEMVFHIL